LVKFFASPILLVLGLLLIAALPVYAQQQPEGFFKGDYASAPLKRNADPKWQKPEKEKIPDGAAIKARMALEDTRQGMFEKNEEDAGFQSPRAVAALGLKKEEASLAFDKPGVSVKRVSVILPNDEKGPGNKHLDQFLALAMERSLHVGTAYIAAMDFNVSDSAKTRMWALNAKIRSTFNLPEQYSRITTMPTWIVELDEGEVILEGYDLHREDFNSKGEILVKEVIERYAPELLEED
jgi:hypothetical protein